MNRKSNFKEAVVTFTYKITKKVSSALIMLKTSLFDIFDVELLVHL